MAVISSILQFIQVKVAVQLGKWRISKQISAVQFATNLMRKIIAEYEPTYYFLYWESKKIIYFVRPHPCMPVWTMLSVLDCLLCCTGVYANLHEGARNQYTSEEPNAIGSVFKARDPPPPAHFLVSLLSPTGLVDSKLVNFVSLRQQYIPTLPVPCTGTRAKTIATNVRGKKRRAFFRMSVSLNKNRPLFYDPDLSIYEYYDSWICSWCLFLWTRFS